MPAKKTLLVGLGNPLNGDDGFGPSVIERLRAAGLDKFPDVSLLDAGTDLLNHIENFSEHDRVLLIDAILDPEGKLGSPGRVELLEEKSFLSWSEESRGVHQMSPLLGVKLFRTLHPEARIQIYLLGLFVDQLSHSPLYLTEERIQQAVKAATDFTNCTIRSV